MRHTKCYRAIELKLLIVSKNVSDKSFSVRKGRHTGPTYFVWVEALKLHQGQLHFLKWNHVFFSMTLLPILRRIQRPTTQGHCSRVKYGNSRKIETYRNNHLSKDTLTLVWVYLQKMLEVMTLDL